MPEVKHVLEIGNVIGEGPIWHSEEKALYWVNFIGDYQILRFTPEDGRIEVFGTADPVMALGVRTSGGFIAATSKGIAAWDTQRQILEPICNPLCNRNGIRFNDAATDSQGRFWVGTMNDASPQNPEGELLCVQGDGSHQVMDTDITVSNGIGWSPDRKIMYFTDSLRYRIYAYDYEVGSGAIANRRTFVQMLSTAGIPDGLAVDCEGFVWSALWGGWRVVRYNPEGNVDREYRLPVPNPTSCAFGGRHLEDLYITSASLGLSQEERAQHAHSGDLFCLNVGIRGMDEPRFAG